MDDEIKQNCGAYGVFPEFGGTRPSTSRRSMVIGRTAAALHPRKMDSSNRVTSCFARRHLYMPWPFLSIPIAFSRLRRIRLNEAA